MSVFGTQNYKKKNGRRNSTINDQSHFKIEFFNPNND